MARSSMVPVSARALLLVAALAGLPGCEKAFGTRDAHQPGQALGDFHVTATRTQNSCGEGALGTSPTWEFDVELARDADVLFWDNGAQVIAGAGSVEGTAFQFDTDVVMDMRQEGDKGPPCSVNRHDSASVVLSAVGTDVSSFTGTLSYSFTPTSGSECSDLVLGGSPNPKTAMPVFAQLPCGFSYALQATRTTTP